MLQMHKSVTYRRLQVCCATVRFSSCVPNISFSFQLRYIITHKILYNSSQRAVLKICIPISCFPVFSTELYIVQHPEIYVTYATIKHKTKLRSRIYVYGQVLPQFKEHRWTSEQHGRRVETESKKCALLDTFFFSFIPMGFVHPLRSLSSSRVILSLVTGTCIRKSFYNYNSITQGNIVVIDHFQEDIERHTTGTLANFSAFNS